MEDAPANGIFYGRVNDTWMPVPSEAEQDGTKYVRQNGAWVPASAGISEAPADGQSYARYMNQWAAFNTDTYTRGETNDTFVNVAGDTMIGKLTLPASSVAAPSLGFTGFDGGFYATAADVRFGIGGFRAFTFSDTLTSHAQHKFQSGSAGFLGVAFESDADTGFWNSANQVHTTTGGVTRLSVANALATFTVPVQLPADPTVNLQAATKQYVDTTKASIIGSASTDMDTLGEIEFYLQANILPALGNKADIFSPTFTGDPKAPTPATSDNDTSIATTAYVKAQGYLTAVPATYAPLASPTFTGDPKAPTPTVGDNDTSIATTAFVTAAIAAIPPPASGATIADAAPTGAQGKLWWNSANGNLYIYYDDGTSSQWVQINSVGT